MLRLAPAVLLLAVPLLAHGQTSTCDALDEKEKGLVRDLFSRLHPYDCCDGTLATCLAAKNRCKVAVRIADELCRLAKIGKDQSALERAFSQRAKSMFSGGAKATFALDDATRAGDPKVPVTAVVYACSRCPYCKVVVAELHRAITEGSLSGKARLFLRPFPLKSHPGAAAGDLALLAAAKLGRFWPFTLYQYSHFDDFKPEVLPDWAEAVGLSKTEFEAALADPATRDALETSKKEGLHNRVDKTPTLFINGRQYVYDLGIGPMSDLILEEYERLTEPKETAESEP